MRDTTQLPGSDELKKIMEFEAKRSVPSEKIAKHYPEFGPFITLLDSLDVDADFMREDISADVWMSGGYQEKADSLMQELIDTLIAHTDHGIRPILDAVYDYLSEEDPLKKSDGIFVFGGKTLLRVEKAIQLYKEGWSNKLIFSGHGPYTGRSEETEAERYRDAAVNAGIPVEDIILETKSITIPDNVRRSLNVFEEIRFSPTSLILVNSPQPQRRGWCIFKKYLPDTVELIRQNCSTAEKFGRDGWFTNPEGIKVVLNEYFKMKIAVTLNTA